MKYIKIKENNRKAFSLVELLFVMVIIGLLAVISVRNSEDNKQSAVYTSLRIDAHNILNYLNSYLALAGDNVNYNDLEGTYKDTNNDGIADTGGKYNDGKLNGSEKIIFSYGNVLELSFKECDNHMIEPVMKVYNENDINRNPDYGKVAYYDGCKMNKIKLISNSNINN